MSLDVYLYRRDEAGEEHDLYTANITHNLNTMADKAGIYELVWRPEEVGIVVASQLIEPLRKGIEVLESDPEFFEAFEPPNKWGYLRAIPAVAARLPCRVRAYPDALVQVSR
jgi:hypothetical protein